MRISLTICAFHLQMRIPRQLKSTKNFFLLFAYGFHKLFRIRQILLRILQILIRAPQLKSDSTNVSGFRKFIRIPLTICGFRIQFADFTYGCGFHNSLSLVNTYVVICLWIPQTVPDSANFVVDFAHVFEQCSVQLFVRGIQNSKEDKKLQCCGFRNSKIHSLAAK